MGHRVRLVAAASLPFLLLAGCSGAEQSGDGHVYVIDYRLWENNQETAYRDCGLAFAAANPGLSVRVTQRRLDDYWSTLRTGFETDTAPDVFTAQLSQFPQLVEEGEVLPLDGIVAGLDSTRYADGLASMWVGTDGKRYGLPKDWNTTALFYNTRMAADAGVTAEEMRHLTWNPRDGGTYEKVIARLTVDGNGRRGDEAGFDKNDVVVHGLGMAGSGGAYGQTEWSYFTNTTGWTHADTSPWATRFNYHDPRFQEAIAWWKRLIDKGYMAPLASASPSTMVDSFAAGRTAINANGSRVISEYLAYDGLDFAIAPTPIGPNRKRASMISSRADSITAAADNKDAAAKWVAFMGSAECQDIVGRAGVVLPAIPSSIEKAEKAFQDKGVDISPFVAQLEEGTTFLFPLTDRAAELDAIMVPAMDAVLSGRAPVTSLTLANERVNALLD